jgi:predicted DNA-binding transcriptional regulator AlpA
MSRPARIQDGVDGDSRCGQAARSAPKRQPRFLPRGMSRVEAAQYIGVSPSLFDAMVRDGRMPGPKRINTRTVWDRFALDQAFEALPDRDDCNPWDEAAE